MLKRRLLRLAFTEDGLAEGAAPVLPIGDAERRATYLVEREI